MELVPVLHPSFGTLAHQVRDGGRLGIDVEIVMKKLYIAENVGGGLRTSISLKHPQSDIQIKLKIIDIKHNSLSNKI